VVVLDVTTRSFPFFITVVVLYSYEYFAFTPHYYPRRTGTDPINSENWDWPGRCYPVELRGWIDRSVSVNSRTEQVDSWISR
jgi:hypothetical protein